jgi:hypothetical protein
MSDDSRAALEKSLAALMEVRSQVDRLLMQAVDWNKTYERVTMSDEGVRAWPKIAKARVAVDDALSAVREAFSAALNVRPA